MIIEMRKSFDFQIIFLSLGNASTNWSKHSLGVFSQQNDNAHIILQIVTMTISQYRQVNDL